MIKGGINLGKRKRSNRSKSPRQQVSVARGTPEEDYLRRDNVRNDGSVDADADAAGEVPSYVFVRSRRAGGSVDPGDG